MCKKIQINNNKLGSVQRVQKIYIYKYNPMDKET